MVNCNPETVSTDYDTSDRLYFEPLTLEDVLAVYDHEAQSGAEIGMIVQFGGQTPLNLALPLEARGRADHRHLAGVDRPRRRPQALRQAARRSARFRSPPARTATSVERGAGRWRTASAIRCWCGPSYVLGGRAMVIAYDDEAVAATCARRSSTRRSARC